MSKQNYELLLKDTYSETSTGSQNSQIESAKKVIKSNKIAQKVDKQRNQVYQPRESEGSPKIENYSTKIGQDLGACEKPTTA